ncbi:MAG: thioredoxin [Fibrobacteria bacterium]|nr:thioredoxin [Fibrobacteria bacterium]
MEHLTIESFKEKVCDCGIGGEGSAEWKFKGNRPAVIDFYADWCGPCKMVAPVLEELSKEYDGQIDIYKVDTEAEPQLAGMFGITSIPSILFVPSEGKPQMSAGAMSKESFEEVFQDTLGIKKAA